MKGINMTNSDRTNESYKKACENGQFFVDESFTWGGDNGLTQTLDGYYVVFLAYDGQRVIAHRKSKKDANKICEKLNSLGSVEAVEKYRKELYTILTTCSNTVYSTVYS